MLSISSCVCWPFVYLLWRNVCLDLSSIFWFGCLLVWYWAVWAACIFWRLILCQLFHLQIFLWGLPFHLAYSFPLLCKAFKFNYFTFISVFIFIILGGGSKSILQWFMSKSVLPMFSVRVLEYLALHLGFWSILSLFLRTVLGSVLISSFYM